MLRDPGRATRQVEVGKGCSLFTVSLVSAPAALCLDAMPIPCARGKKARHSQRPEGHTEQTLAALLDAVVPGADSDPEGAPGALEGCALNLLMDDAYPFRGYAAMIVTLMDQTAQKEHGAAFAGLPLDQRVDVRSKAEHALPLLRVDYRAIRSAFYGGAYNGLGLTYLHYPGTNLGYRHLPEASLRRPVCKELTETGWMP